MFVARQVIERTREWRRPAYMAFIDLAKAYDSVPRDLLFATLESEGIPRS